MGDLIGPNPTEVGGPKIIKLKKINKIKICICIYSRRLEMVEPGIVVIARSGYVVGSSGVSTDDAANEYCYNSCT